MVLRQGVRLFSWDATAFQLDHCSVHGEVCYADQLQLPDALSQANIFGLSYLEYNGEHHGVPGIILFRGHDYRWGDERRAAVHAILGHHIRRGPQAWQGMMLCPTKYQRATGGDRYDMGDGTTEARATFLPI